MLSSRSRRRGPLAALVATALGFATAASFGAAGAGAAVAATVFPAVVPDSVGHVDLNHVFTAPPTTAQCEAAIGIACYSPLQYQQAYDMKPLYADGLTGAGHTIAVVDSFGSPTIARDLRQFDADFGLPDPNLSVLQVSGAVPAYKANALREGWAFETTLDVEYAHAMAPGANILLVETPVAETEGATGLPEMMDAELYVVQHHLADVISQSFGASEPTFASPKDILRLRYAFTAAAAHGVTVLASSGDDGVTDSELTGDGLYPYRINSWPSSDPLVTSVGGTMLSLNAAGNRTKPDRVWNDGYGAGGGGVSSVFARPGYQDGVASVVGAQRGTPDVSLSAAVNGAALVYLSFRGLPAGYYLVGGTSEASPLFAGIVAVAAQRAGHGLGQVNPALYGLGYGSGLVDITKGNNSFAGVTGYKAVPGYDLASGLGTVDGAKLVASLAGS